MTLSTPTWIQIKDLLARSYAYRLLESYVKEYNKQASGKVDLSLLAKRQESFDHIVEVFEQDLRLGSVEQASSFCKSNPALVVTAACSFLLSKQLNLIDPGLLEKNLCLSGILSEKTVSLAKNWLTSST